MACGHGSSGQRAGEGTAWEGDQAFVQQHEGGALVPGSQLGRQMDKSAWPWRGTVAPWRRQAGKQRRIQVPVTAVMEV